MAGFTAQKTVIQSDVLDWLALNPLGENQVIVASIPDAAELANSAVEPWRAWFTEVAERIFSCAHPSSALIFYQSDVRYAGTWIDKGFMVQQAAQKCGATLLSHRIVCRHVAGTISFHRAAYSHLMLFSKTLRHSPHGYCDVIADGGPSVWSRGIGLHSCETIVRMARQETRCDTLVHLFSGKGLLLELARREGLHAIGVDVSKKHCRHAQRFDLDKFRAHLEVDH